MGPTALSRERHGHRPLATSVKPQPRVAVPYPEPCKPRRRDMVAPRRSRRAPRQRVSYDHHQLTTLALFELLPAVPESRACDRHQPGTLAMLVLPSIALHPERHDHHQQGTLVRREVRSAAHRISPCFQKPSGAGRKPTPSALGKAGRYRSWAR